VSHSLFIRIGRSESECTWLTVDESGRLIEGLQIGSLEEAAQRVNGRRVVLLIPGLEVLTTQAELPTTSQARLRKMLPYSLEDTFAEDIEQLMFAVGAKLASGAISVSVVAKKKLDAWLDDAAQAGIAPHAVYAETDGVPDTPATLNIIVEDDVFFGRRPAQPPLALQGLDLDQAFRILAATSENEPAVQHAQIFVDEAGQQIHSENLRSLEESLSSLSVKLIDKTALAGFAAKLAVQPGTNLLQGSYAPRSNWGAMLKPWRFAASLLVGLGIIGFVAMTSNYLNLKRQDNALTAVLESECQQRFSSSRLSQCESEVQERLRMMGESSASDGSGFLSTLGTVAELSGPDKRFETMSYRNSILDVQLIAPDVPALDEFSQAMTNTGRFLVTIQSTNPDDDGIEGRLQIVRNAE